MIAVTRPWIILFDPISFFCAVSLAVVYTLLYMLFEIYPFIFQLKRGWEPGFSELPLLGTIVGCLIGSGFVVLDTRKRANRIKRGETTMSDFVPEGRLGLAMMGGICFAVSMFWLAWTGKLKYFDDARGSPRANADGPAPRTSSIRWIVSTLSGLLLSSSLLLVFMSFLNYIVDSYLLHAASAIAANTIVRSACGVAAPLFTLNMFKALGVGAGGSLVGGVASLLAVIPFLFKRYGREIRSRSKFAPATTQTAPEQFQLASKEEEEELAVMTAYRAYASSTYSLQERESPENGLRHSHHATEWPLSA